MNVLRLSVRKHGGFGSVFARTMVALTIRGNGSSKPCERTPASVLSFNPTETPVGRGTAHLAGCGGMSSRFWMAMMRLLLGG